MLNPETVPHLCLDAAANRQQSALVAALGERSIEDREQPEAEIRDMHGLKGFHSAIFAGSKKGLGLE